VCFQRSQQNFQLSVLLRLAIPKLPPKDLAELKAWLEDFFEDQLELNDEVKAELERSHCEISTGQYRTLKP